MEQSKNMGFYSQDPMTGEAVFVKPGEKTPTQKRKERKEAVVSLLRQYASKHSCGTQEEETDEMVSACNDAADMLERLYFDKLEWAGKARLESIFNMSRFIVEGVGKMTTEEREKRINELEREVARNMMEDVLYSGLVTTTYASDYTSDEVRVKAEMLVGVRCNEDLDAMLRDKRNYEKYRI